MATFRELGLSEPLLEALAHLGYEEPTPIQEQAIPALLEGRDVIGQAQTGTGKTAAFGLPLLEYVDPGDPEVQALVLTPTRELCIQVTQALRAYGERKGDLGRGGLRRRADPRPDVAREGERAGRGRHGRPRDGPDGPPRAGRHVGALRRARRGRRDARPRLLRGRRDDPLALSVRTPDGALLGHDAARDQAPGRAGDVRPGHDQGEGGHAHDRHRRAVLRRRLRPRQAGEARRGRQGRAPGPGDHLRAHEDRRRPALTAAERRRRAREGAARRHVAGSARRRDDRVQVGARAAARRDRRRRARPRHLGRHARDQLRRAELARHLRAPDRPHRPRRALRARDHVHHPEAAARPRGDRAPREDRDRPVVRGRARRAAAEARASRARGPAATPHEAAARPGTARGRS